MLALDVVVLSFFEGDPLTSPVWIFPSTSVLPEISMVHVFIVPTDFSGVGGVHGLVTEVDSAPVVASHVESVVRGRWCNEPSSHHT